jgi:hypothetical protein
MFQFGIGRYPIQNRFQVLLKAIGYPQALGNFSLDCSLLVGPVAHYPPDKNHKRYECYWALKKGVKQEIGSTVSKTVIEPKTVRLDRTRLHATTRISAIST